MAIGETLHLLFHEVPQEPLDDKGTGTKAILSVILIAIAHIVVRHILAQAAPVSQSSVQAAPADAPAEQAVHDSDSVCRVCRSPSSEPLFHPCKCAGSMKFVHQSCLEEWLAHSGKSSCEICNHPFVFSPIYDPLAPETIPLSSILAEAAARCTKFLLAQLRISVAVVAWVACLPFNVYYIRSFFVTPSSFAPVLAYIVAPSSIPYASILSSHSISFFLAKAWDGCGIIFFMFSIFMSAISVREYVVANTPHGPDGRPINMDNMINEAELANLDVDADVDPPEVVNPAPPIENPIQNPIQAAPEPPNPDAPIQNDPVPPEQPKESISNADPQPSSSSYSIHHQDQDGNILVQLDLKPEVSHASSSLHDVSNLATIDTLSNSSLFPNRRILHPKSVMNPNMHHSSHDAMYARQASSSSDQDQIPLFDNRSSETDAQNLRDIVDTTTHVDRKGKGKASDSDIPASDASNIGASSSSSSIGPRYNLRPRSSTSSSLSVQDTVQMHRTDTHTSIQSSQSRSVHTSQFGSASSLMDIPRYTVGKRSTMSSLSSSSSINSSTNINAATHGSSTSTIPDTIAAPPPPSLDVTNTNISLLQQRYAHEMEMIERDMEVRRLLKMQRDGVDGLDEVRNVDDDGDVVMMDQTNQNSFDQTDLSDHSPLRHQSRYTMQDVVYMRQEEQVDEVPLDQVGPMPIDSDSDSDMDVDGNLDEQMQLMLHDLQNQMEQNDLQNAPIPEQVPEPIAEAEPAININFQLADGNALIEINAAAGDLFFLLEFFGIRGPISNIVYYLAYAHLMCAVGVMTVFWIPKLVGRTALILSVGVFMPAVVAVWSGAVVWTQSVLDMVLDPIVDFVLRVEWIRDWVPVISNLTSSTTTASSDNLMSSGLMETSQMFVDSIHKLLQPFATVSAESETIGPIPEPLLHYVARDTTLCIVTGHILIILFVLMNLHVSGFTSHPYATTLYRYIRTTINSFVSANKFGVFMMIELVLFPMYCGALIDAWCSFMMHGVSSASDLHLISMTNTTMSSAYQFIPIAMTHRLNAISFIHWLIGTTFLFQIAVYVTMIRDIIRPGVLWFIRDPNDPAFNPINEFAQRPVLTQLRRVVMGVMMYTVIICGLVGGVCLSVWGFQELVCKMIRQNGIWNSNQVVDWHAVMKIFPVRYELHDHVSLTLLDLLIMHTMIPMILNTTRIKSVLMWALEFWFESVCRILRLSMFILGEDYNDEKSDFGDIGLKRGKSTDVVGEVVVMENGETVPLDATEDAEEWIDEPQEEEKEVPDENISEKENQNIPQKNRFRFMRVPNHDRIEVVPGRPVMIPMKDDDVLKGYPGETAHEIKTNWTKIYIPPMFWMRICGLLVAHVATMVVVVDCVVVVPLVVGRIGCGLLKKYLTIPLYIPSDFKYEIPANSVRHDLVVHDIYAFGVGLIVVWIVLVPVRIAMQIVSRLVRLERRNAVLRRQQLRRNNRRRDRAAIGGLVGAPEIENEQVEEEVFQNGIRGRLLRIVYRYLSRQFLNDISKVGSVCFVVCWFGIVIPLLLGIVVDLYFLVPLKRSIFVVEADKGTNIRMHASDLFGISNLDSGDAFRTVPQPVVFVVQDWTLGLILVRLMHLFVMNVGDADNRLRRVVAAATQNGFARMDCRKLFAQIVFPVLFVLGGLLVAHANWAFVRLSLGLDGLFVAIVDGWMGDGNPNSNLHSENNSQSPLSRSFVFVLFVAAIVSLAGMYVAPAIQSLVKKIRDDRYLIGRRLLNVDEKESPQN